MKCTLPLLLFCLFFSTVMGQGKKGITIDEAAQPTATGKTYALIIGISKYKNTKIPSLQYADRDAIAFRDFLVQTGVDSNNITLLLNQEADHTTIMLALYDLCVDKAKRGDRVYIYFSGHGDVESHVITNDGYLLPSDSRESIYSVNAINVRDVQSLISTMSSNGVEAIVLLDACHAGKLAGGSEGMKNIQLLLGDKWKNETKILSCQPGEFSLEDKQWGNGRGLFSYELINGLSGLADRNHDGKVTLRELDIYLSDKVPDEAIPMHQNPVTNGDKETVLAYVKPQLLADVSKQKPVTSIPVVNLKGMESGLLAGLDDSTRQLYAQVSASIDSFANKSFSLRLRVNKIYQTFLHFPEIPTTQTLLGILKGKLANTLISAIDSFAISEVNNEIYLGASTTPVIAIPDMDDSLQFVLKELVGEKKLSFVGILPKIFFLQTGKKIFNHPQSAIDLLDSAIAMTPNAAYLYVRKASCLESRKQYKETIGLWRKAIALSPYYYNSYLGLAHSYKYINEIDSSISYYKKLLLIDTIRPIDGYAEIASCYVMKNAKDSSQEYFSKYFNAYMTDKAMKLSKHTSYLFALNNFVVFDILDTPFFNLKKRRIIWLPYELTWVENSYSEYQEKDDFETLKMAGSYYDCGNYAKSIPYFEKLLNRKIDVKKISNSWVYRYRRWLIPYQLACASAMINNTTKSLYYLEVTFQWGYFNDEWETINDLQEDCLLENIHHTPEYKALLKRYCPNEYFDID